jgi:hypothetical protein
VRECQKAIDSACRKLEITRFTHHDLRHLFATRCIESGVDIPTVSRWLGHKDGGALAMKTYGHLRDLHSTTMAQKVVFSEAPQTVTASSSLQKADPTPVEPQKKSPAQAKAKYNYPWWASENPLEVFWGQINEEVQLVPSEKYYRFAQEAMAREIFPNEFADRQALVDECLERIPKATLDKLTNKFARKQAEVF